MLNPILRALLEDKNVPSDVTERILEAFLREYAVSEMRFNPTDTAWGSSVRELSEPHRFIGPHVDGLTGKTRVTRVMSLEAFSFYTREHHALSIGSTGLARLLDAISVGFGPALLNGWSNQPSRYGVIWTGLEDELRGIPFNEVESGLGLIHIGPGRHMVAVSYTIAASDLRVPTIIDAAFQPGFVVKPAQLGNGPRAWDWRRNRWGLTEMIHRSDSVAFDPEVRYLGQTTDQFVPAYDGLASFSLQPNPLLDQLVSTVLLQAVAHRDLLPFLCGEVNLLEISHREFEYFVALLYARRGYKTMVTQQSQDGGIDVIAVSDSETNAGVLIQAKHTRGTVGIRVVRELIGARFLASNEFMPYMLVVTTTGTFSRTAKDAESQHAMQIKLEDYDALQRQLKTFREIGITDIVMKAMSSRDDEPVPRG